MKHSEKLAKKISSTLTGLCPAFSDSKATTAVWHGCKCAIDGNSCVCVWHLTSECQGGTWKQLSFVDAAKAKEAKASNKLIDAVYEARR